MTSNYPQNITGIIPAAGRATRLAPLPFSKELFPMGYQKICIDGREQWRPKTVSQHLIDRMVYAGVDRIFIILGTGKEAIMEYYKRFISRSDPWPPDLLRAFEELNTDVYGLMWGPSELAATGTLKDYEREEALPGLDLPVLFTTGRYDEATPETVEHYSNLVPGSRIVIFENSAHMTMLDEPVASVESVRAFLKEVDSGS